MINRAKALRTVVAMALLSAGCASNRPPTARPLNAIPAQQASGEYWYAQPATHTAASLDFDRLWNACDRIARDYQFTIDRTDYREGLLTTHPMVSEQFFEPWRRDAGNLHDVIQSSLQTVRRTIRFQIARTDEGSYEVRPMVLIEQLSQVPARITSPAQYREVFTIQNSSSVYRTDDGKVMPVRYWFAIGRDDVMERHIAQEIADRVRS